ncbi:aspartyl protease family protein [Dyella sp. GSA-30]|uniref:aspartyl protease family protein n=1 Tax=Dyella sp. GSA-30 TaxID=2994496 RepID=UPI00249073EE|nr:aspartyl protease family protein [Dyella sp. GSA-30]
MLAGQAWADGCQLKEYGTLPVEMIGNRAITTVKINGADTHFILDTGAFFNTMSNANALSLGLKLELAPFGFRVNGVGGSASVQQAHVKQFGILGTTLENIDFIVGGSDAGHGLLGANLLDVADLEIDLAHGKMTLFKADHCDKASLAYWVKDGQYNVADIESSDHKGDRRTFFDVTINGKKVRALLDSGAVATVLGRDAAERVGIDLNAPDVRAGGKSSGIGAKVMKSWIVNIDTFSVGTETIQHSQMQVIDGKIGNNTDMLLGVDFLLAHHMFIGNGKKKAYFTYNGGRVFTFASASSDSDKPDAGAGVDESGDKPKTAEDYFLLGQAHLSRGETNAAQADLDEAIRLTPDNSAYYVARAKAHEAGKQFDAELADLDKALSLDPKNTDALMMRAGLRFARKDRAGAASDVTAAADLAPPGSPLERAVASFYIRLDQPFTALPLLGNWIRRHDDDAKLGDALAERCWARGLSNQVLDEALQDCKKAIRRDGENPFYLDALALVELRLGQYSESIKTYQKVVAQKPMSAWARYGLGLAKIHSGDKDAGHADLAAARTLDQHIDTRIAKWGLLSAE